MKEKILVFNTYKELNYWFEHIINCFCKSSNDPNYIKVNRCLKIITVGDQRWYFSINDKIKDIERGRRDCKVFYNMANKLEENYEKALLIVAEGK